MSIELHWKPSSTPSTVVINVESRDTSLSRSFTNAVTNCTFGPLLPETAYKVLVYVLFNKKSNPTEPERAFVAFNGWLTTRRLGESDGDFISHIIGCMPKVLTVIML